MNSILFFFFFLPSFCFFFPHTRSASQIFTKFYHYLYQTHHCSLTVSRSDSDLASKEKTQSLIHSTVVISSFSRRHLKGPPNTLLSIKDRDRGPSPCPTTTTTRTTVPTRKTTTITPSGKPGERSSGRQQGMAQ